MGATLQVGGKRRVVPAMNVTPLVDVVLVLLIIFMVIAPMMVKGFWLHVPKKEAQAATPDEPPAADDVSVVVTVRSDRSLWINQDPVALADLGTRLERIFAARTDRVVFFDAASDVPYGDAMAALDAARAGGAVNIAVLTESVLP